MNWFLRNKEWVVGVVVPTVLAIIGWMFFGSDNGDQKQAPAANINMVANGNGNSQVYGNGNITDVTIHGDHAIINTGNIYKSADYLKLQNELKDIEDSVKESPENLHLRKLQEKKLKEIDDFKRDVLKLAEDFNKIPINTKRLRLAKQYFDTGDYQSARTILDAELMSQDQGALLDKKKRLDTEQAELGGQLNNNANEFLLKAKLTAIDYSLPDRIAQTSGFFEKALQSAGTPDNLFAYAYFLQDNNQFKASEQTYQEALGGYRKLAADNPAVYLPYMANTLNNLGNLVSDDSSRRQEAETLFQEALGVCRKLAADNPAVYLPKVATTLNNLGLLVQADSSRRKEAEALSQEALDINRKLAAEKPQN